MAFADIFSVRTWSDVANVQPVAFFICLRECLEAGIISMSKRCHLSGLIKVAVLLGFINQVIPTHPQRPIPLSGRSSTELLSDSADSIDYGTPANGPDRLRTLSAVSIREEMELGKTGDRERMIKAMRLQIWTGAILGGLGAAIIGAVFLYVVSCFPSRYILSDGLYQFYTYTHDLWQDAENLWEGGFCAIASFL